MNNEKTIGKLERLLNTKLEIKIPDVTVKHQVSIDFIGLPLLIGGFLVGLLLYRIIKQR